MPPVKSLELKRSQSKPVGPMSQERQLRAETMTILNMQMPKEKKLTSLEMEIHDSISET